MGIFYPKIATLTYIILFNLKIITQEDLQKLALKVVKMKTSGLFLVENSSYFVISE